MRGTSVSRFTQPFKKENIMSKDMAVSTKEAFTSNRGRNQGLFNEGKPELPTKNKKMLFVSPHQKQGFKVPVRDSDGKIMMQINQATGRQHLINGRPIPALRDCNFLTQSNNVKRGCLSYYETDDPDEIEVLNALANAKGNEIMTEDMYLKSKDPVAYKLQTEVKAKDVEIEKLREEKTFDKDVIADLEAQIAKLTKGK
jgi:hypothetical protein